MSGVRARHSQSPGCARAAHCHISVQFEALTTNLPLFRYYYLDNRANYTNEKQNRENIQNGFYAQTFNPQ